MGLEQASVVVASSLTEDLSIFGVTENCHKCNPQPLPTAYPKMSLEVFIDSRWRYRLDLKTKSGGKCSYLYHFKENWHYRISVTKHTTGNGLECVLSVVKEASSPYIPIVVMFAIYAALIILYKVLEYVWDKAYKTNGTFSRILSRSLLFGNKGDITEASEDSQPAAPKKVRLRSLDTFRGIAITVMIFVNYGGGSYYFFNHSLWNGLTVADLVFPWFIFIMGTSIHLSQKSLLAAGGPKLPVFWKILIRSIRLFFLGFFLSRTGDLSVKRIPGVLQRFAISYFAVATTNLLCTQKVDENSRGEESKFVKLFGDITRNWLQWLIMLTILLVYLVVTFLLEVPGCPTGYLGPGGIGDYGKYPLCTGGAAGYIDKWFFGEKHIYGHPTCEKVYVTTEAYDPEGMLGSLTSIFLTYLGLQAGRILAEYKDHSGRMIRWMAWGVVLGILAIGLTGGTQDGGVIPINKNLWSVSFIFATGSMAYILLTILYAVIDTQHWWKGGPFFFAGMNAIFLYCGHELLHGFFPFNFVVKPETHASRLASAAIGASLWVFISYYLYRRKIFFKV